MHKITPCLWFDFGKGDEAVALYTKVFPNSRILRTAKYPAGAPGPEGTTMTIDFELCGQPFMALNGGPHFQFNEAISLSLEVDSQAELDDIFAKLTANGGEEGPCGWLKDRFGLSWQLVPRMMAKVLSSGDAPKIQRMFQAMMKMKKLDIAALEAAANG